MSMTNDLVIIDAHGLEIHKSEQEYEGKENVIIENLTNCKMYIPFKIKSLYVKNMANTSLFVGCVSGASFIN